MPLWHSMQSSDVGEPRSRPFALNSLRYSVASRHTWTTSRSSVASKPFLGNVSHLLRGLCTCA